MRIGLGEPLPDPEERVPHEAHQIHIGTGRALDEVGVGDFVVPVAVAVPVEEAQRAVGVQERLEGRGVRARLLGDLEGGLGYLRRGS